MAEYLIQSETLDDIADAINAKTGGSSAMTPAEMVTEIAAIPSGGGGGEVLLGSGTYTLASDASSMEIPISVLGTPTCCFVEAESVSSEGLQTAAWCVYKQQHTEPETLFRIVNASRVATASGYTSVVLIPQAFSTLDADKIIVNQVNNNYKIRANTYKWYVWGTAT